MFAVVALTNHLTKNMQENTKKNQWCNYLESKEVNPTQHEFRHKRSTTSYILSFYENFTSKLENTHDVDAIYLDFSKAFDNVDHHILLLKVTPINITGKILKWLETFPKKKQQRVKVNSHLYNIWAEDNNMLFNRDTFELLNFRKSARSFYYETPPGKQIQAKASVRDLGITS